MSMYVRWRPGEPRECRLLPPLAADHPAAGHLCPACGYVLDDGDPVQLLAIGPDDKDARERHRDGRWYSALALLFHAACLGTEVPA